MLVVAGLLMVAGRGGSFLVRRFYCTDFAPGWWHDISDLTTVLIGARLILTLIDVPAGLWSALIFLSLGVVSISGLFHYVGRMWKGDTCSGVSRRYFWQQRVGSPH